MIILLSVFAVILLAKLYCLVVQAELNTKEQVQFKM